MNALSSSDYSELRTGFPEWSLFLRFPFKYSSTHRDGVPANRKADEKQRSAPGAISNLA